MAVVGWAAAVALAAVCEIGVAAQAPAEPPPVSCGAGSPGYPLLVLPSGRDQCQHSAERTLYSRSVAVLAAMQKDGVPPAFLVGIENRHRIRDLTPIEHPDLYVGGGGAVALIRFLETDLVPFVEARWPVGSRRIL